MNRYQVTPGDFRTTHKGRKMHQRGAQVPMLVRAAEVVLRLGIWLLLTYGTLMFFILYVMGLYGNAVALEPDFRRGLGHLIAAVVAFLLSLVPLLGDGAPWGLKVLGVSWAMLGVVMALVFAIEVW